MAWNQPGSGGNDPWGQRGKSNEGPPDLDEIVKNLQKKLGRLFGGRGGGGSDRSGGGNAGGIGLTLVLIVVLLLWGASGFYIVEQGERGVVQRFGEKSEITGAGLRWHLPWPVETVTTVDVQKIHPVEIGYRTNVRSGGKTKNPREALMLTEDENIIDIEFAVQYRILKADDYLFNVRDTEDTIKQATESAIREIAGKSTMDFVLTEGRDEVAQRTEKLLQEILDHYNSGILITKVEMQEAQPPEEVKAAFDDAVKAREDEVRYKNEAEAYSNDILPRARGRAARMLEEAEAYKASVTARAEGDARRFSQILAEYEKAPRVTRDRLYLEAMEQVFSSATKIFVDQKGGNNLMYLPLDKLMNQKEAQPTTEMLEEAKRRIPERSSSDLTTRSRTRTDLRSRGVQ